MKPIRILSIDGGGIRGVIPATILVTFEQLLKQYSGKPDARLCDYVDLIAGTSTGGILAALYNCPSPREGYKAPYSAQEALGFYREKGKMIFKKTCWQSIRSLFGLVSAKYSNKGYVALLDEILGETKLSELYKPCLITAYDIERREAILFNQMDPRKSGKADFYIKDIVQATSAAPTYFQPAFIKDLQGKSYSLIDGGVFANNPTLCAYAEASKLSGACEAGYTILSLGTGSSLKSYTYEKAKGWGGAGWIGPLLSILLGGVAETVDYQVNVLYQSGGDVKEYVRIQTSLSEAGKEGEMDNVTPENIERLEAIGQKLVKEHYGALDQLARSWVQG